MKTKSRSTSYIVYSIMVAGLLLTVQISLAGSATWLFSPQDSAWENADNWTPGGPPNGPSDIATFAQSSQTDVGMSTAEEVNSIVFTSGSASFRLFMDTGGQLTISGAGVNNNNSVSQTFWACGDGQIIFNNTSTAASAQMDIVNWSAVFGPPFDCTSGGGPGGQTIFNDMSSAAGASIANAGSVYAAPPGQTTFNDASTAEHASITNDGAGPTANPGHGGQTTFNGTSTAANASIGNLDTNGGGSGGQTTFNGTSTAGHATITNDGDSFHGGTTVFDGSSTADNAIIIANGVGEGGAIFFNGASTGGTARVEVFDNGHLDISGRQPGVTIGSSRAMEMFL